MTVMTGGEAVIETLIANGIDTVFGLPGAQLDPAFAALHDRQSQIRVVHTRHEQGAAYMAFGYAEVSGEIGTLLVVPGPGLLNAASGIVTGYARNTPMLSLVGQSRSEQIGKGYGVLHEIPDQLAIAAGLHKTAARVTSTEETSEVVSAAIASIRHHRPRPAYVEFPFDLLKDSAEVELADPVPRERVTPPVDTDRIEAAARKLAAAKVPADRGRRRRARCR